MKYDPLFFIESARKELEKMPGKKPRELLEHIKRDVLPTHALAREISEYFLLKGKFLALRIRLEEIADAGINA